MEPDKVIREETTIRLDTVENESSKPATPEKEVVFVRDASGMVMEYYHGYADAMSSIIVVAILYATVVYLIFRKNGLTT